MSVEQKKVTVRGTEYTLQMVPAMWYLETNDDCMNSDGVLRRAEFVKAILENVVVSPRVTINNFTGKVKAMGELVAECEKFISGGDDSPLNADTDEAKNDCSADDKSESDDSGTSGDQ